MKYGGGLLLFATNTTITWTAVIGKIRTHFMLSCDSNYISWKASRWCHVRSQSRQRQLENWTQSDEYESSSSFFVFFSSSSFTCSFWFRHCCQPFFVFQLKYSFNYEWTWAHVLSFFIVFFLSYFVLNFPATLSVQLLKWIETSEHMNKRNY